MGAPAKFHSVNVGDDVLDFRLTHANVKKMEMSYKMTYQDILGLMDSDPFTGFEAIMWCGRLPFDPKVKKSDMADLWDNLVDEGYDATDISKEVMFTLQESGLIPKDYDIEAELAKADEESDLK